RCGMIPSHLIPSQSARYRRIGYTGTTGYLRRRRLPIDTLLTREIAMKIVKVNVIPLVGGTVDGGWPQGHEKKENLHTLLEVMTDEGISGVGGVYTSGALTEGAMGLLGPLLKDETALEPERVTEKLRQSTFWQGRGGSVEHTIS